MVERMAGILERFVWIWTVVVKRCDIMSLIDGCVLEMVVG